jgi:hypothetical protein
MESDRMSQGKIEDRRELWFRQLPSQFLLDSLLFVIIHAIHTFSSSECRQKPRFGAIEVPYCPTDQVIGGSSDWRKTRWVSLNREDWSMVVAKPGASGTNRTVDRPRPEHTHRG